MYAQGANSDTWHWCKNCTSYPSKVARTSQTKPTSGEFCDQCKSKEVAKNCTK